MVALFNAGTATSRLAYGTGNIRADILREAAFVPAGILNRLTAIYRSSNFLVLTSVSISYSASAVSMGGRSDGKRG